MSTETKRFHTDRPNNSTDDYKRSSKDTISVKKSIQITPSKKGSIKVKSKEHFRIFIDFKNHSNQSKSITKYNVKSKHLLNVKSLQQDRDLDLHTSLTTI